jgi:hypothetical protein
MHPRQRQTLAAMHTGVVQNKSINCQADRSLLDGKKEKNSCPVFLLQSNLLLKKTATNVHGSQCPTREHVHVRMYMWYYAMFQFTFGLCGPLKLPPQTAVFTDQCYSGGFMLGRYVPKGVFTQNSNFVSSDTKFWHTTQVERLLFHILSYDINFLFPVNRP